MTDNAGSSEVGSHTGSGRERKKAAVRRRILEASKQVFFRDGFMETNLDEIAELAGIAKGTIYRYFDNKAQLYVAVLSRRGRIFEQKLHAAIDARATPLEALRQASHFYLHHYVDNRDYFQIFWALENQAVIGELPQAVVDEVTRLWERSLGTLARIIDRGVREGALTACDPWEVATILWTLANALIRTESSSAHRRLRRHELEHFFDDAIGLMLNGLTQPAGRRLDHSEPRNRHAGDLGVGR
jgi:AcrR family transcriptional regulator